MAAINANGLIATPITPSSGRAGLAGTGGAGEPRQGGPGGAQGVAQKPPGPGGGRCRARGAGCTLPSALAADWLSASARRLPAVCPSVCLSLSPARNQHPSGHRCHARPGHPCRPGRQRLQPRARPAHRAACPRRSVPQRGSPLPRWGSLLPARPRPPAISHGPFPGLGLVIRPLSPALPPGAGTCLLVSAREAEAQRGQGTCPGCTARHRLRSHWR